MASEHVFAGTTAVVLLHWWGVFRAPDVLFFLVLLLTHTTPTAINLQVVRNSHHSIIPHPLIM